MGFAIKSASFDLEMSAVSSPALLHLSRMDLFFRKDFIRKVTLVYTVAILLLVTLPINGDDQFLGNLNDTYILRLRLDYLFHSLLFIPWVVLGAYGWEFHNRKKTSVWLAYLGALLFSVLCEYVQLPLPYRTFNINDLVSNMLGVTLGFLISRFLFKFQ